MRNTVTNSAIPVAIHQSLNMSTPYICELTRFTAIVDTNEGIFRNERRARLRDTITGSIWMEQPKWAHTRRGDLMFLRHRTRKFTRRDVRAQSGIPESTEQGSGEPNTTRLFLRLGVDKTRRVSRRPRDQQGAIQPGDAPTGNHPPFIHPHS